MASPSAHYAKVAMKILELLEEVPKDSAGHILDFVAKCRGVESSLCPPGHDFVAVADKE